MLLATAGPSLGAPSAVASKEAQVRLVLAQIQGLDSGLERAIEAYNAANGKLYRIKANLRENKRQLALARQNLRRSQAALSARLVAIYTSGEDMSAMSVLLGATSLDDLLNRIDFTNRASHQDAVIHREVTHFRAQVQRERARLKTAKQQQVEVVQERAAHRASIQQQLADRHRLVDSIRSEIEKLRAEERAREARAAAEARRRLAAAARHPTIPTPVSQVVSSSSSSASSSSAAAAASPAPAPAPAAAADPAAAPAPVSAPAPAPPPPPTPAPAPASHGDVVSIAMSYLGTPYAWGGASPSGFDCSGFVMYVFSKVGISLPHNAAAQYGMGSPVSRSDLQPGDLVFFDGLGHVGIYIGGDQFVHAPHTGDVVKVSSMSGWYASSYVGARRI